MRSILQMGGALDIMRFKAVYTLTSKKTYAAMADAGLVDEFIQFVDTKVMPTGAVRKVCAGHSPTSFKEATVTFSTDLQLSEYIKSRDYGAGGFLPVCDEATHHADEDAVYQGSYRSGPEPCSFECRTQCAAYVPGESQCKPQVVQGGCENFEKACPPFLHGLTKDCLSLFVHGIYGFTFTAGAPW